MSSMRDTSTVLIEHERRLLLVNIWTVKEVCYVPPPKIITKFYIYKIFVVTYHNLLDDSNFYCSMVSF